MLSLSPVNPATGLAAGVLPKVFSKDELKALRFTLAGSSLIKENLSQFKGQADLTKRLGFLQFRIRLEQKVNTTLNLDHMLYSASFIQSICKLDLGFVP